MDRIPDSPEGVALALVALILGCGDLAKCCETRDADQVIALFRRCMDAVRDGNAHHEVSTIRELTRSH
jgi:hypothetical protein